MVSERDTCIGVSTAGHFDFGSGFSLCSTEGF